MSVSVTIDPLIHVAFRKAVCGFCSYDCRKIRVGQGKMHLIYDGSCGMTVSLKDIDCIYVDMRMSESV